MGHSGLPKAAQVFVFLRQILLFLIFFFLPKRNQPSAVHFNLQSSGLSGFMCFLLPEWPSYYCSRFNIKLVLQRRPCPSLMPSSIKSSNCSYRLMSYFCYLNPTRWKTKLIHRSKKNYHSQGLSKTVQLQH